MRRTCTAVLLLVVLMLAPPAQAHARPVQTSPAPQERLAEAPALVSIEFNEPVNTVSTTIVVRDASGERVDLGDARVLGARRAQASLRPGLSEAGYVVEWQTYSTVDGHRMRGLWAFAVGNASMPSVPQVVESPIDARPLAGRVLALWALAVLSAGAFLVLWFPDATRSRRILTAASTSGYAASTLILLVDEALRYGPALPHVLSITNYGQTLVLRSVLAVILLLLLPAWRRARRGRAVLLMVLLAAAVLLQARASHAANDVGVGGMLLDAVHLGFALTWVGGVLALHFGARLSVGPFLAGAERFPRIALGCVVGLLLTGPMLAIVAARTAGTSLVGLHAHYGLVVLYKLALFLVMVGFGAANHVFGVRGLRATLDPKALEGLGANLRREAFVGALILLLAAVLMSLDPRPAS